MSKTIEELIDVFYDAEAKGTDRDAIVAVVRALRDEIAPLALVTTSMEYECGEIREMFNEILGDAGEKVAGSSAREDEVGVQPLPVRSPATDYSRKQCDNCDWPSLPECRKCGYPFAATPATDPAPAVCEFRGRPGRYIRSCNGARSIYDKPFPPEACAFCKKPVKFTEAK